MDTTFNVVAVCLSVVTIAASYLATILTRKGKKEDQKLSERQTAYEELVHLCDARLDEINRLNAERVVERAEFRAQIDRLASRCRAVTDALMQTVTTMRIHPEDAAQASEAARRTLAEHREDEHGGL